MIHRSDTQNSSETQTDVGEFSSPLRARTSASSVASLSSIKEEAEREEPMEHHQTILAAEETTEEKGDEVMQMQTPTNSVASPSDLSPPRSIRNFDGFAIQSPAVGVDEAGFGRNHQVSNEDWEECLEREKAIYKDKKKFHKILKRHSVLGLNEGYAGTLENGEAEKIGGYSMADSDDEEEEAKKAEGDGDEIGLNLDSNSVSQSLADDEKEKESALKEQAEGSEEENEDEKAAENTWREENTIL